MTVVPSASLTRQAAPRIALVLLSIAVHANGVFGQFILDDIRSIVSNSTVHALTPLWRVLFGSDYATTAGRPLLNLSLALNYAVSGAEPWSYHVYNIAVHALVAWLMFEIVLSVFRLPSMPRVLREGALPLAWTTAALWAVHPLTTSAVVYCVQRAESMCALACLGMLYSLMRHEASLANPEGGGSRWLWLATLCGWTGVSTKEVAATAPIIAILFDRVFLAGSWRDVFDRRGTAHLGLFASWAWLGWLTALSGGRHGTAGFGYGTNPLDYLLTQFRIVPDYLALAIFPVGFCADWGFPLYTEPAEWGSGLALLLLLGCATLFALAKCPRWGFAGAWFFIILGPTSSFIPLVTQTGAEHRMYLPLMGLIVGAVAAVATIVDGLLGGRFGSRMVPRAVLAVGLLAIAACSVLSFQRNALYADPVALWKDAVRSRPDSARAWGAIAIDALDRADYAAALEWIDPALSIPGIRSGRQINTGTSEQVASLVNIRGFALMSLGRGDEALAEFDRAIRISQQSIDARLNRARMLIDRGRFDDALADCDALLELNRKPVEALNLRGLCQLKRGEIDKAMADAQTLVDRRWPIQKKFADALRPLLAKPKAPAGQSLPRK